MSQTWDPDRYARNARNVADLATDVVALLSPRDGQRILDLGCGDGALTERLAAAGCEVVGVDSSEAQVAATRGRGLDARLMDGSDLSFDEEFDAVFSNMALHWMPRVDDVMRGVWRALRPGGRFVGELGGRGCIATIVGALHAGLARRRLDPRAIDPWHFWGADDCFARLGAHGFVVEIVALVPRPTRLPGDCGDVLATFGEAFLAAVPVGEREAFVDEVRDALRPRLFEHGRGWIADYVVLRFAATKPTRGMRVP